MNLYAQLKNIYTKQTYAQKYGGYMWMSLLIITVFITIIGYLMSGAKTNTLKKNWSENRCNPGVMPFAGVINNTSGKSAMEYTEDNFTYCVENVISSIANAFIAPLLFALSALNKIFSDLPGIFSELFKLLQDLMNFLKSLMDMMMVIIENVIVAIERLVGDVRDIIGKLFALKGAAGGIVGSIIVAGTACVKWIFFKIVELLLEILLIPLLYSLEMSIGAVPVITEAALQGEKIHDVTGFSEGQTIGIAELLGVAAIAEVGLTEGLLVGGIGNILGGIVHLVFGEVWEAGFFTFFLGVPLVIIGVMEIAAGLVFLALALVIFLPLFSLVVGFLEWVEENLIGPMEGGASSVL
uniref:Uncharacterized protein n=1 Tax=viral metagenome TaxID=1070528 RepID=A0A6C0BYV4_9ZZZZ